LWLAAPLGITAAAMAVGLLCLSRALVLTAAALHALNVHWASLAQPALRGLGLTAGVAAAVLSVQLPLATQAPLARLAASALAPTLAVALLLWLRPRWCQGAIGPQAWAMVLRFAPALGGRPPEPQTRATGLPSQQH
jgi:hypothetical protein